MDLLSLKGAASILQFGLSGLCFYFIFFTYKLLRKEQAKDAPDYRMLGAIKSYLFYCLLLGILVGLLGVAEKIIPSPRAKFARDCQVELNLLEDATLNSNTTYDDVKSRVHKFAEKCRTYKEENRNEGP
jgi:hypothetical protein